MKKLLSLMAVYFVFVVGAFLLQGCEDKSKPQGVVVSLPEKGDDAVMVEALFKLKPRLKESTPYILKIETDDEAETAVWKVRVNKTAAKALRKAELQIRLHVGYCWYAPDKMDSNGVVTFAPEWTPPLEESRVSVGLFKLTNKPELGSGYYVSSVLVKEANSLFKGGPKIKISGQTDVHPENVVVGLNDLGSETNARVDLTVESLICNQEGGGSNPPTGSDLAGNSADELMAMWGG